MNGLFAFDWTAFIAQIGNNPFQAMFFLLINGGWLILLWFALWVTVKMFQGSRQAKYGAAKEYIVLAIDVPRTSEQGPRAVENMFAYLAGAHAPNTWTENYIVGRTQDTISMEIITIEGHVQFLVRTTRPLRDIVEAAIYSQYPDAEIVEVEDYAAKVPQHYPDEEWDLWGTEMTPVRKGSEDVLPLKTYTQFEDRITLEFKDPLSALLESFSRLGPGEQAWYQIVLTPIDQKAYQHRGEALVKKLTGRITPSKPTMLDHAADLPLKALGAVSETLLGGGGDSKPVIKKEQPPSKLAHMTTAERDIVSAVENKVSKIGYLCKIRFLYVAKKQVMSKAHIVYPFIGAIKQFNTNNMQSLKPETKRVGMSGALWWFKKSRNNGRKNRFLRAYRSRSNWAGLNAFHLCTEELATLWHFPHSLQVKTPQLKKTEAKRTEPPANLPFAP